MPWSWDSGVLPFVAVCVRECFSSKTPKHYVTSPSPHRRGECGTHTGTVLRARHQHTRQQLWHVACGTAAAALANLWLSFGQGQLCGLRAGEQGLRAVVLDGVCVLQLSSCFYWGWLGFLVWGNTEIVKTWRYLDPDCSTRSLQAEKSIYGF